MISLRLLGIFSVFTLVGSTVACTASTSGEDVSSEGTEEELKAAECPDNLKVTISTIETSSDAVLEKKYDANARDEGKSGHEQLVEIAPLLAQARADEAGALKGTLGKACAYATVDAKTNKPGNRRFWLAKTQGSLKNQKLQFRMYETVSEGRALFFNAPLKAVSKTAIGQDTSQKANVYAQDTESTEFHGQPDGFSRWIGTASIVVTVPTN